MRHFLSRRARLFGVALLPVSALAAPGCGGSGEFESGKGGPKLEEIPAMFAEAACAASEACLGGIQTAFLGGEDCEDAIQASLEDTLEGITASHEAGRVRYDSGAFEACLDAIRTAECDFGETFDSDVCRTALDGTVAVGGDCDFTMECEGSAYCRSPGTCPGECAPAEPEDGPCTSDSDCAPELECDEKGGACFTPALDGATCGGGVAPECGAGLFCIGADDKSAKAGTCKTLSSLLTAAEGETCSPITGPLCGDDLRCTIHTLQPFAATCMKGVGPGAPCQAAFPDRCPADQYCATPGPGILEGTCEPKPAVGEPCSANPLDDTPVTCAIGARCDGGTCRARQDLGGACTGDAVCKSEHCVDGVCALDGSCE